MITFEFNKRCALVLSSVGLCLSSSLIADEAATPTAVQAENPAAKALEACTKKLLTTYFPEDLVNETLKKFHISQDKWAAINKNLSQKDKELISIVKQKAAKMDPNPLNDPQLRGEQVKLFRQTLLEVFSDALKANGISDDKEIQQMLSDIQQQRANRFTKCMEEAKAKAKNGPIEEDDEDEDED